MSRRLSRTLLALVILASSEVWALGLGEIRLQSALNEPLRAEIELLSATPEELSNLQITMASAATFERYGIDRPVYLQGIQFNIVRSGSTEGNIVQLRSAAPITEPFLTFLVEANWARGRLLREYTVLLDPPTFAPPASEPAPAVTAPTRSAPADSGRIERAAPPPQRTETQPAPRATQPVTQPVTEPVTQPLPQQEPVMDDTPFDTSAGGDVYVQRGDTLWGIAQRVRPDSRLTMNQTMLAIFEANPQAFGGNINMLEAGASLRVPSADEIFRISRGDALSEVQRQHQAWGSGDAVADTTTRPSLELIPPDDDIYDSGTGTDPLYDEEPLTREEEIQQRIDELMLEVPTDQSLIEIRDNELAALRQELANIRGEIYEPPVEDPMVDDFDEPLADDEIFVDDPLPEDMLDESLIEEGDELEPVAEDAVDEDISLVNEDPAPVSTTSREAEESLVDKALGILTSFWTMIAAAVVVVVGLLLWFMSRGSDDADEPEAWRSLDADDVGDEDLAATESLRAPTPEDESIVVVEQESALATADATADAPAPEWDEGEGTGTYAAVEDDKEPTGEFGSLEDTFSSETAVNLDQSDPIAEADFHMAYGLYDQAADLINGALGIEPERTDLLTKLCEIYFVWGNRDAFIDAAGRLKSAVGDGESAEWDKIVIMGQQIASDDALFAGAGVAGATKEVDLSFEGGEEDGGALDMELFADSPDAADDVVDLGAEPAAEDAAASMVDFDLAGGEADVTEEVSAVDLDITAEAPAADDLDITAEAPAADDLDITAEAPAADDLDITAAAPAAEETDFDLTAEMPAAEDATAEMPAPEPTVETPTIEQQLEDLGGTAELPSLDDVGDEVAAAAESSDSTAEINLDDLGLDLDGLEETELAASLDDLDDTAETTALSDDTGINEALTEATGKNPEVDPNATGVQVALSSDDTGIMEAAEPPGVATDVDIDDSLLEATGVTQVLPEDLAVETVSDLEPALGDDDATMLAPGYGDADATIGDDQETLLASLDDDDDDTDYDFAKTEALPADVFTGDASLDETGELPAMGSTDVDLDLDDLTAALQVSDAGDTIEQMRDDATVEQPRPVVPGPAEDDESSSTVSLGPDDMSEDLHDARTMTEVGTKLDLARAYVDMGDPAGARSILEEVLDEGDEAQRQQAQQLLDSLPS